MLTRDGGASIDELIAATNWLPHTTRAAIAGLRRRGHTIERSQGDDRKTIYRIVASQAVGTGLARPAVQAA